MVTLTDNHELQKFADDEEPWEHRTDMDTIERRLIVRDTEANITSYTPHSDAIFIATDTGAVYDGDGSSWNAATRELGDFSFSGDLDIGANKLIGDNGEIDFSITDTLIDHTGSGTVRFADVVDFGDSEIQNVNHIDPLTPQDVTAISAPSQGAIGYHDGSGSLAAGLAQYDGASWVEIATVATSDDSTKQQTLTDDGTASDKGQLLTDADFLGVVGVLDETNDEFAEYFLHGSGNEAQFLRETAGTTHFTSTEGNAGTVNVYWDATNTRYEIENNSGGQITVTAVDGTVGGGGTTATVEYVQDTIGTILSADFNYDDATPEIALVSNSVTVAGNSVALGGSTGVNHADLSAIGADDHHNEPTAGSGVTDEGTNQFGLDSVANGTATLSNNETTVDTGHPIDDTAEYTLMINPDNGADIAASLEEGATNYVVHLEENTTEVGNPDCRWRLIRYS